MEQYCTIYARNGSQNENEDIVHDEDIACLLVLTPILSSNETLPYYHPTVFHLAFQFVEDHDMSKLQISVIPFKDVPIDITSRLYRICLALLETVHRYGWGALTSYKKRVEHDRLVPREAYQDLYLVMRERHKHLVGSWAEKTDPLKHVFEVRKAIHDNYFCS
jgi:tRNASer (uridine44-2'-O)-methyltransferase